MLCPILCDPMNARFPCPPLSPGVFSDSCSLSQWCYLTISSFAALFSFCLQSFLASGSFPMSRLFTSDGQSTGASASASVLPMKSRGWFPLGLTGLISLQSSGFSKVFSSTHNSKTSILQCLLYGPNPTYISLSYTSNLSCTPSTLLFRVPWMCNTFSHLWVLLDGDPSVWNALLTPFSIYQHFIESTWFKYSLSFQIFSWLSSQN